MEGCVQATRIHSLLNRQLVSGCTNEFWIDSEPIDQVTLSRILEVAKSRFAGIEYMQESEFYRSLLLIARQLDRGTFCSSDKNFLNKNFVTSMCYKAIFDFLLKTKDQDTIARSTDGVCYEGISVKFGLILRIEDVLNLLLASTAAGYNFFINNKARLRNLYKFVDNLVRGRCDFMLMYVEVLLMTVDYIDKYCENDIKLKTQSGRELNRHLLMTSAIDYLKQIIKNKTLHRRQWVGLNSSESFTVSQLNERLTALNCSQLINMIGDDS